MQVNECGICSDSFGSYQYKKRGMCLSFYIGADDFDSIKSRSGSDKLSPAALIRAAFRWVRVPSSSYQHKRGAYASLFILVRATGLEPARSRVGT